MIRKFLLLVLVLLLTVRSQSSYDEVRDLRQSNMVDVNNQQNFTKLNSVVPSHNKPLAIIEPSIEKQQHKNGTEGVVKGIKEKNITFVQGLSKNMTIKHVTVDQRSKTQISQKRPSEQLKTNKIQDRRQQSKIKGITPLISKQSNNDLKDQKQSILQVKENITLEAQPLNISLMEEKIARKSQEKKTQIYNQIVKIQKQQQPQKKQNSQQKINNTSKTQSKPEHLVPQQQVKNATKAEERNIAKQFKVQTQLNLNKTEQSEISIQIIQSPTQQQISEYRDMIKSNQSLIQEQNSPKTVEIFKVLQEIKIQNKSGVAQQITEKNQSEQIQVVEPASQEIEEQIKIIPMDNDDQDSLQPQKPKIQAQNPIKNPPLIQTTTQLKEIHEVAKQISAQTKVIIQQDKKMEQKQQESKIDNQNEEQAIQNTVKPAQIIVNDEQDQVKVEIIQINSQDQTYKQQILPKQQIKKQYQINTKDIQQDRLPQIINQIKKQQQILNQLYKQPIKTQSDGKLQGSIQNVQAPSNTPIQQVKQIPIEQPKLSSPSIPHQDIIKKEQLQVLLTTVKENLEGQAKVNLIQYLEKEIKLTEQLKAIQTEKTENKLMIHRQSQSQYANLKESQAVPKDIQLPLQQNMDAQTVIVIIVLTFIISIPIVKEIRQKPNKNEPKKRKQSTNTQMEYPQDNQSGFQVDETFDQEYLSQANKNPNERTWEREIEEA